MKEETGKWLKKAERDLVTANYNFKGNMLEASVFFSQQAAEKALKAIQIERLSRYYKIHDLIELAKSVKAEDFIVKLCDKINPGYFVSRYPDIEEEYDPAEVKEILNASAEVVEWAMKKLK